MKSFKVRLELNQKQTTLAMKHAGVARFAYNWALARSNDLMKSKTMKPTAIDLHKLWVAEVKSEKKWTYEVSKCSPQQAFRNLDLAFKRFYRSFKNGKPQSKKVIKYKGLPNEVSLWKTLNEPNFKKKGLKDSFYLEGYIQIIGKKIKLPKFGWLRLSESLTNQNLETQVIKNVVVSRQAEFWFVSFKVEHEPIQTPKVRQRVGVDLGIKTLAAMSDGDSAPNVRAYRKYKRKLKIAGRKVSKKFVKDSKVQSNNYRKATSKVAKIHYKIASLRKDSIHKLTTKLAKNHSEIVIEDLNVKGMSKNRRLSSAILDGGFFEFRRQLEYKATWYGAQVIAATRFFPSSKKCSNCGHIKQDLKLKDRVYHCLECGLTIDRDFNASLNLENYNEHSSVSYTENSFLKSKLPVENQINERVL